MRELTKHIVPGSVMRNAIRVLVLDGPGPGGANLEYQIMVTEGQEADGFPIGHAVHLFFQKGGVKEAGVNGIVDEALLEILIDRLEGFQRGPFACDANAEALEGLNTAMRALTYRTQERIARGVEGVVAQ